MLAAAAVLATAPALAGAEVPRPVIPEAEGEQCVEPTEVMRKEHFKFIKHQRDETVHEGIRSTEHSLKGCIDCHVQPNAAGEYPRVSSEEHFCQTCHAYAAVTIDCFQCHADRPQEAIDRPSALGDDAKGVTPALIEDLTAYVNEGDRQP
jgi:hypothetical protein